MRVLLRPRVEISAGDKAKALALHHEAHHMCFIARSVNFAVDVEPEIIEAEKVPAAPRVESRISGELVVNQSARSRARSRQLSFAN